MVKPQYNGSQGNTKQLQAKEVHALTMETLQTYFQLDMEHKKYSPEAIWDVIIAAAVERTTIEMACDLLEDAPSPNTVRQPLKAMLPADDRLDALEEQLNEALVARLPKHLLQRRLPTVVDLTEIPYHGEHPEDEETVRRGRAKRGTTHFHCYATLFIVKNHKRYTLALTFVRRSDQVLEVLKRLMQRAEQLGWKCQRLMLDREFDNNAGVAYLKAQPWPAVIPLTIRGKTGGTRALLQGKKSAVTTYTRESKRYGPQRFDVYVVCKYSKGRYARKGRILFAYVVIGDIKMPPTQVYEEYRRRFGIESSYRLMNQARARTSCTGASLRLFFVGLALILLNLWVYIKWIHLYIPKRGPRKIFHDLLPFTRWRIWLWEVVKQRLGLSMQVEVPA
jgi:putative transposase